MSSSALLARRLYRSLLKAAGPFCSQSTNSKIMSCLLYRTGLEDESWASFLRDASGNFDDEFLFEDEAQKPHYALFRTIMREILSGGSSPGIRQMQWPASVDSAILKNIIKREFRNESGSCSVEYATPIRQSVAFTALAALNKKIAWYEKLKRHAPRVRPQQAAAFVSPLPLSPPKTFLRPGAFLVAHPHLIGYFRRTVVCILDHKEEQDAISGSDTVGTYGVIINRNRVSPHTNKNLTLDEVLRPLPEDLEMAFGGCVVKEGGPVHMSLQMLHSATPDQEDLKIGGYPLPMIADDDSSAPSTAQLSDRAIYYKGDVMKAANAVLSGSLDREDITFFVGASAWQPGQLESEIERGCWLPCRGPPEIAHSGICEHDPTPKGESRPLADLWLSMLSSCGEAEAELAHLLSADGGDDELGRACDDEDD
jgi:putative AlgH/UPF0301 family transcriptional regulator